MKILTKAALASAVSAFAIAKSTVAEANEIIDAAVELDALDALDANADLAKLAEDAGKKKGKGKKGEDETVKSLQRQVAVLSMPESIRKHYDALPEGQRDAFIAKDDAGRQAEVDQANSADPVVHKCKDGTEIRKSDGAVVLAMAKRMDALSTENAELRKGVDGDAIEKRARAEFPNVALGTATASLALAKQLGEDTPEGKDVLKGLAAMNKAATGLFKRIGSEEAPEIGGDIQKARQDYDTEVAKVAREEKIGLADAMSKVRNDRPDLFAAAYPENADEDEQASA